MNAEVGLSQSLTLPIEGMTCASRVGRVDRALRSVQGVTEVYVNLATESARVRSEGGIETAQLVKAVEGQGYSMPVRTIPITIDGMTCAGCAAGVERALLSISGVTSANVMCVVRDFGTDSGMI